MRAILGLLTAALLAIVAWQWRAWPPEFPSQLKSDRDMKTSLVSGNATEQPAQQPLPLRDKEDYALVWERPLFRADRKPLTENLDDETALEEQSVSDIDGLDLNAVLITPSQSLAWVRDPDNKRLVRLRAGDNLSGWIVHAILSDRVVLEREGEEDTLVLRDYSNLPSSPAGEGRSRPPRGATRGVPSERQEARRFDQNSEGVQ